MTSINDSAFGGSQNIETIIIPDSVTYIDSWAFYGVYVNTINYLGDWKDWLQVNSPGYGIVLFNGEVLTGEIHISDEITRLKAYAFYGQSISSVYIPSSVTYIETQCFAECENLTDIYYDGTKEEFDAISKYDWKTTTVTLHCTDGDYII